MPRTLATIGVRVEALDEDSLAIVATINGHAREVVRVAKRPGGGWIIEPQDQPPAPVVAAPRALPHYEAALPAIERGGP